MTSLRSAVGESSVQNPAAAFKLARASSQCGSAVVVCPVHGDASGDEALEQRQVALCHACAPAATGEEEEGDAGQGRQGIRES